MKSNYSLQVATFITSVVKEVHFGSSAHRQYTLAAPARKSQFFNASLVKALQLHFGSSGSKVATFQHKCSKGTTLWQLRLESRNFPARKSQLSGSKVLTFQYKCSKGTIGSSDSKVATFQYKCSKGTALWQLRLESRNFSVQV